MTADKPKVIGFDADDTLWINEPFFREAEIKFSKLLEKYGQEDDLVKQLFETEVGNLQYYGYGIKSFTLSMIECAMKVSSGKIDHRITQGILEIGHEMLQKPVEVLDGVHETLAELKNRGYKLIVATKGDLVDQELKLEKSGLERYFHHIEIMKDKQPVNYLRMLGRINTQPGDFLMVGNSLKSDILPLLEIGARAVYIPFHTTWEHEYICENGLDTKSYNKLKQITQLLSIL